MVASRQLSDLAEVAPADRSAPAHRDTPDAHGATRRRLPATRRGRRPPRPPSARRPRRRSPPTANRGRRRTVAVRHAAPRHGANMSRSVTSSPRTTTPRRPKRSTIRRRAVPLSPSADRTHLDDSCGPCSAELGAGIAQGVEDRRSRGRAARARRASGWTPRGPCPRPMTPSERRAPVPSASVERALGSAPHRASRWARAASGSSHSVPWLPATSSPARRSCVAHRAAPRPVMTATTARRSASAGDASAIGRAIGRARQQRIVDDRRERAVEVGQQARGLDGQSASTRQGSGHAYSDSSVRRLDSGT